MTKYKLTYDETRIIIMSLIDSRTSLFVKADTQML